MAWAWVTCPKCGERIGFTYDQRDYYPSRRYNLRKHIWEKHKAQLPKFVMTWEQFVHYDGCTECNEEKPCSKFPVLKWIKGS